MLREAKGLVSLAPVRAQSVDLRRLFDISARPTAAVEPLSYLYGMYDNPVYDLYVLYDNVGHKKCSKSHLNLYGSNGYV